ncbi:hypothetical protein OHB54_04170 [Streptomyces sp. NBC_01007]|nr:hypothetical protein OHB54_04170 [Streptomyces sp. NBC_01007]
MTVGPGVGGSDQRRRTASDRFWGDDDLVGGGLEQNGEAHPLDGQSRRGRRDVVSEADQRLVDRQQREDLLLKTGHTA